MSEDYTSVDVVKSIAGLLRYLRKGEIRLANALIDIDGEGELGLKILNIGLISFKDCEVRISNITIESHDRPDGKCLELVNCRGVILTGSTLICHSRGTDPAPYPPRANTAACIYSVNSDISIRDCIVTSPGQETRGLVSDLGSMVKVIDTEIKDTHNSGVWARNKGICELERVVVRGCGGYGALYCTNGARLTAEQCHQSLNPRGCGVFVLHEGSRVFLNNSTFDSNKWSGFGCRWSGGGAITNCTFDSNGQGAWAIRKSTIKDIIRKNNVVTNDFTEDMYSKVSFLFVDPLNTAVVQKGLTSRGLSVAKARELVDGERRMREATRYQAKFLFSRT